jgi:hypothetical protein
MKGQRIYTTYRPSVWQPLSFKMKGQWIFTTSGLSEWQPLSYEMKGQWISLHPGYQLSSCCPSK